MAFSKPLECVLGYLLFQWYAGNQLLCPEHEGGVHAGPPTPGDRSEPFQRKAFSRPVGIAFLL
jgi:hypothetical protein